MNKLKQNIVTNKIFDSHYLRKIEFVNQYGYNLVSQDYNNPSHRTCRNFELVSKDFIFEEVLGRLKEKGTYLDVGTGRGFMLTFLDLFNNIKLTAVDISPRMLTCCKSEFAKNVEYIYASVFSLPFPEGCFDGVFASLGDSFAIEPAFREIYRVLKYRGIFYISVPTRTWARTVRNIIRGININKTWFKTNYNKIVLTYSWAYDLPSLIHELERVGFKIITGRTLTAEKAVRRGILSPVNKEASEWMGIPPSELPLLSAVMAEKSK